MKILAYSSATAFGGHEVMALAGLRALLGAGHRVELVHFEGNLRLAQACQALAADCPTRFSSRAGPLRARSLQVVRTWLDWTSLRWLNRALRESRCDRLLALQGDIEQGSEALLAAALARVPALSYLPMVMPGRERGIRLATLRDALSRPLYRLAARMIVISPTFERRAAALGCPDVKTVYNCIDDDFFDAPSRRLAVRERLGIAPTERISGFIGRIAYDQKGIDRLLEVIRRDVAYFERNRVLVVGSGPDQARLAQDLASMGLERTMIRCAWDDDRLGWFDAIDVFLCLSRFEGVPLTVLEASARGVPVLSVPLPTLADHLPLRYLGPNFDPQACLAALVDLAGAERHRAAGPATDCVRRLARFATFERGFVDAVVAPLPVTGHPYSAPLESDR